MGNATRPPFDWWGVVERGLWTGVQVPSVAGIFDGVLKDMTVPGWTYIGLALGGIAISVVKTIAQHRLRWLDTRTPR